MQSIVMVTPWPFCLHLPLRCHNIFRAFPHQHNGHKIEVEMLQPGSSKAPIGIATHGNGSLWAGIGSGITGCHSSYMAMSSLVGSVPLGCCNGLRAMPERLLNVFPGDS